MTAYQPLDPVAARFIGESESKRALRQRLRVASVRAQTRAERAEGRPGFELFWEAAMIARQWETARASEEQLQNIIVGLTRLFLAANAFERAEADDGE